MRILVVDDEPLNLRLVEAAVTRLGHQATAAADGEAAWQCYNQDPPEVLITDLLMPRVEGLSYAAASGPTRAPATPTSSWSRS